MYVTPEQIQAANKANVEAFLSVANAQFAALEKLANLNAQAVRTAFEDSLSNTRALLGAKDVQEFVSLQNTLAQPAVEKAIAYGFSTTTTAANQDAGGRGIRTATGWRVILTKPLAAADDGEVAVLSGTGASCAFAVWSGGVHDAGSRKCPATAVHALNVAP